MQFLFINAFYYVDVDCLIMLHLGLFWSNVNFEIRSLTRATEIEILRNFFNNRNQTIGANTYDWKNNTYFTQPNLLRRLSNYCSRKKLINHNWTFGSWIPVNHNFWTIGFLEKLMHFFQLWRHIVRQGVWKGVDMSQFSFPNMTWPKRLSISRSMKFCSKCLCDKN